VIDGSIVRFRGGLAYKTVCGIENARPPVFLAKVDTDGVLDD
jgi:hypothetical protein